MVNFIRKTYKFNMEIEICGLGGFYRVESGDSLLSVSRLFDVDVNNIVRNNPSIDLYEGEILKILTLNGTTHIVRPGETLEQICNKYDACEEDIIELNNLKNKRLFIGQKIQIKK